MCMRMPGFCLGWGWCVECDVKDSAFGESPRLKDVSTPSLMRTSIKRQ